MGLHQPAGQGQTQPGAALARHRIPDLLELLKHPSLVGHADAHAGVGHGELYL